ncbi:MAG: DciA family protein [bacterium]
MAQILKETISGLMHKLEGQQRNKHQGEPRDMLKKAFTKKELEHVQLHYFNKGILALRVDSSSWLYTLSLKKEELLHKLRNKAKVVVQDIRFSLGEEA